MSAGPASYEPRRFESGTFPVSKNYHLKQMLYNYSSKGRGNAEANPSDPIVPSFPFGDVPVYADTVDLETLAFHDFWGCLLTPDNVASRIRTDDLRYHVWVATKRVVESGTMKLTDKEALVGAVMVQFMVELGLAFLDLCPGPIVLFVDPRLHYDAEQMVSKAAAMVAKFDEANVRRWRIIVTLPATEDGVWAARELTHRHGIQTNLTLVACLAHASACIEAGARMLTMGVEPIMEWFEQQRDMGSRVGYISQDHPGIEAIQSCATFIRRHRLNTTLLTTDFRMWGELKQLSGIGGAALKKNQLDQIPMQRLTTWYPPPDDRSPATIRAMLAKYPSSDLDLNKGFLAALPAECRSLVSAVFYVRLGQMEGHMETIETVVWSEIKRRVQLESIPLERLYRPSSPPGTRAMRWSTSGKSRTCKRGRSRTRDSSRQETAPTNTEPADETMEDGVDYF